MYPKEMIDIVKNFYNANKYSIREMAEIFKISKSTIHRWIHIDIIKNKKIMSNHETIKEAIEKMIKENPFMRIKDMKLKLKMVINKDISYGRNICVFKKVKYNIQTNITKNVFK